MKTDYESRWDDYWQRNKASFFGRILEIYRKLLIASSIGYYANKYFPGAGIFVEAGSGTSQTSLKIDKKRRMLIAVDISKKALEKTRSTKIDERVNADIFYLPFKNSSVDGAWNHGVLEHFSEREIQSALAEIRRVLKPGSFFLVFWPPVHGSAQIALNPVEFSINIFRKKKFQFFPDEVSKLKCRKHAKRIIEKSGLEFVGVRFNHRDFFTNYVVICRKPV